jgi:hypothetical protein
MMPKPGMYRVLADYYPANGSRNCPRGPSSSRGGDLRTPVLEPDVTPKHAANLDVELVTEPRKPIAGAKTMLFFRVKPGEGLEPYLRAWAHMQAASDDLIDLIHTHPFLADGGPRILFNLIFPRAHLPDVGPIPAQRRREHRGLHLPVTVLH